jgi:hypothetical protein
MNRDCSNRDKMNRDCSNRDKMNRDCSNTDMKLRVPQRLPGFGHRVRVGATRDVLRA